MKDQYEDAGQKIERFPLRLPVSDLAIVEKSRDTGGAFEWQGRWYVAEKFKQARSFILVTAIPALALFLAILATPSLAAGFSCQKLGSLTRCSDGSHIERMGSQTFIRKRDASGALRSTRCETIGSVTRCR